MYYYKIIIFSGLLVANHAFSIMNSQAQRRIQIILSHITAIASSSDNPISLTTSNPLISEIETEIKKTSLLTDANIDSANVEHSLLITRTYNK